MRGVNRGFVIPKETELNNLERQREEKNVFPKSENKEEWKQDIWNLLRSIQISRNQTISTLER